MGRPLDAALTRPALTIEPIESMKNLVPTFGFLFVSALVTSAVGLLAFAVHP